MWRRSPRIVRSRRVEPSPFRAPRLSESLAIGLGCDRTPPGSRRRTKRTAAPDQREVDRREMQDS